VCITYINRKQACILMRSVIEVSNLVKRFGNFPAVDGISFSVPEGETFAFLGPNGAGKTTTIKMLTTLLHPTSGSMKVNGYDPVIQKNRVRSSFGIVFQDNSIDDELTAYENLMFHAVLYGVPKEVREGRIHELLRVVDLWDRKGQFVKAYSGGMRRRLEIARALIHHPKILFMDEPTLGLDPQTRKHIWEHIKRLTEQEKMTVFLTTHYMEEADRMAKTIAVIDHGKIIAMGTSKELKENTKTATLEDAFLALTGKDIREENATGKDTLRRQARVWRH